jgi:hypothetical protein
VTADNVGYLVATKFVPLGLATGDGRDSGLPVDEPLLTLKLRRTMIGEGAVQVLARIFEPLFTPLVVVVVLAGLIGSDAWLVRDGRLTSAFQYVLLRPMLTSQSLDEQARALTAAFAHGDIPAGVVGVISAALLVMPVAGLSYILLTLGKKAVLAALAACRRQLSASPG